MIRNLYFVQITVADWQRSVAWYRDLLGLQMIPPTEPDKFALFEIGAGRLALKRGESEAGTVLLHFEVADLQELVHHLAASNVLLTEPIRRSPEGYEQIQLLDPDGYRLSFFQWNAE